MKEMAAAPEVTLYVVLKEYPLGAIISIVITVLLCTFFITSANSGTFVLSQLSTQGSLNPPKSRMFFWGIVQSVMAVGMLIAGGLKPLQTVSIAAAFPFIFIMFACMVALVKALNKDDAFADDGESIADKAKGSVEN
jgi:glycine betaine transporter